MDASNKKRNSDNTMELDVDNLSQSEYTPSARPVRRKVSMGTRRHSRMLYLEKYGLNQPGWHSSQDEYEDNDNSADTDMMDSDPVELTDEPETISPPATYAPNTQAIVDAPVKRPLSVRNYVQNSTFQKRPVRFIKPRKSEKNNEAPSAEFNEVHMLIEEYTEKVYMEGYLHKRNDLNTSGASYGSKKWSLWYVELCGPVLTLWDAETKGKADVYPQYINITDSTVTNESRLTAETRPNLFSLNSAGANRFLLQASCLEDTLRWIRAIRLSCFECSRIQEIYTKAFISRPQFSDLLVPKATNGKKQVNLTTEGFVQVRFPGATGWKKFWAVVSNYKTEKRLFNKKLVPTNGQIMFFETRKAKYPMMTLENVVQVYTVYPESPKLINMATLFKIEGSLYKTKSNGRSQQLVSASSSALIMTSNTNELVQWLIGSFDAFKLYGRPDTLLDDPKNPRSLNFAESIGLFLELNEVESVDASFKSTLSSTKKEFTRLLEQKILYGLPTPAPTASKSQESITSPPKPPTHSASTGELVNNRRLSNRSILPGQQRANTAFTQPTQLRTVTCASDVSNDEEDEEDEEEADSDSDDSLYKIGTKPTRPANAVDNRASVIKPITPNTSKSSSEISEVSPATITATTDLFLPPVTDMMIDDNFSNDILQHKYPQKTAVEETSNTSGSEGSSGMKPPKPFYAQQKSASMMQLSNQQPHPWPMYGSTGSVVMGDHASMYGHNNHSNQWETASVDPHLMAGGDPSYFSSRESIQPPRSQYAGSTRGLEDEDEDDDMPIVDHLIARDSLLHRASNDRVTAKQTEHYARATGQPFVQISSKKNVPRVGLMSIIPEKENGKKTRSAVDEQMMMRERMMMDQRQQQQQQMMMQQQYYNGGNMMPMMMPTMMDPRMMPMMDPRFMSPQPMMMYDPRLMPPPPMMSPYGPMIMPSPTVSSSSSVNGRYQPNGSSSSVNYDRRGTKHNRRPTGAMSSSGSVSNQSIRSATTPNQRYASSSKRSTTNIH